MADAPATGMTSGDPLEALRDIHLPAVPEFWPPAPGWWLVMVVVVLLTFFAARYAWQRWQQGRYRREGIKQLKRLLAQWQESGNELQYLNQLQTLLKQVALTGFDRALVASLTGESWVSFLDQTGNTREFSMGAGQVLIDGHYRVDANIDPIKLNQLAADWITGHQHRVDNLNLAVAQ